MLTAIVLFLFLLITPMECMTVLRHSAKKTKILHLSLMLISFGVLMLYTFNVSVPSPAEGITDVIEAIFHLEG